MGNEVEGGELVRDEGGGGGGGDGSGLHCPVKLNRVHCPCGG
jgi:hypothetical protein